MGGWAEPGGRQGVKGGIVGQGKLRRFGALVLVAAVVAACNGLTVDQRGVYTSSPTQTMTRHRRGGRTATA